MVPPQAGQFQSERGWSVEGSRSGSALGVTEQLKAERQEGSALPVGEEAEVADAHEAFGKHVQQEAAQELLDGTPRAIACRKARAGFDRAEM